MRVLADTNIVVRLFDQADPGHALVRSAVALLANRGNEVLYTPQVAREVYHTCMRPRAGNGLEMTLEEAREVLEAIERSPLVLLNDTPEVYLAWRELIRTVEVRGRQAHDANLAAALRAHGVGHLLTMDRRDFGRYPGVGVLTPAGILGSGA